MPRKQVLAWEKSTKRWQKFKDGKKHYLSSSGTKKTCRASYEQALAKWRDIEAGLNGTGEVPAPTTKVDSRTPQVLSFGAKKYTQQETLRAENGEVSPDHARKVGTALEQFSALTGDFPLSEMGESKLETYLEKMRKSGLSPKTQRNRIAIVRQFLKWCWKNRLIRELPRNFDDLKIKVSRKPIDVFQRKQIRAIQDHLQTAGDERMELWFLLGLNCGFTVKDIAELRGRDIKRRKGADGRFFVTIEKNRTKTEVPSIHCLWKRTEELLKKHRRDQSPSERLFLTYKGNPLVKETGRSSSNCVTTPFTQVVRAVLGDETGLTFKHLRKTGATFCRSHRTLSGTETLYLAHSPTSIAHTHYSAPNPENLFTVLSYLERDWGFHPSLVCRTQALMESKRD